MHILALIDRLPAWLTVSVCLLLTLALGYLDFLAGDYSLMLFYLVPIFLATWFLGRIPSLCIALLCGGELVASYALNLPSALNPASFRTWNTLMEALFLLFAGHLLYLLRRELELHKELAFTDPLTGLLNRRSFFELAGYELDCTRRYRRSLTIIYIDIDDFKVVNDKHGHAAGDLLLVTVARTIRDQVRMSDLVARVGGDEFVVLLPETGREAGEMLRKLHAALNAAIERCKVDVTTSMGAVTFESPPSSLEEMMKLADQLMYSAKQYGKNYFRHMVFEELGKEPR